MVLPPDKKKRNILAYENTFGDFNFVKVEKPPVGFDHFDISSVHGRLSIRGMFGLLGRNATLITILRNPIDQFVSMWSYYHLERTFKNVSLEDWIMR